MAIIRRLDLDADARLSTQEFAEGLKPQQPFNKNMKRNKMRKGSNSKQLGSRQGLKVKSGQILMMKKDEMETIKTQAMDRFNDNTSKGLQNGTTPLKARPIVLQELVDI